MYRSLGNIIKVSGLLLLVVFVVSCANGKVLTTQLVRDAAEVQGGFTLTRYSGQDMNYFEVVSLLDIEGDEYEIGPMERSSTIPLSRDCLEKRQTVRHRNISRTM